MIPKLMETLSKIAYCMFWFNFIAILVNFGLTTFTLTHIYTNTFMFTT